MSTGTLTPRPHSLGLADRPNGAGRRTRRAARARRPAGTTGPWRWLGLVAAVVIAVGVLAMAVAAGLFGSDESRAVVNTESLASTAPDPTEVTNRFVADWAVADWAGMTEYADAVVVNAARRAHVAGMQIAIVGEVVPDGGELLLTDPSGTRASIFLFTLDRTDGRIVRLDGRGFAGNGG